MLPIAQMSKKNLTSRLAIRHNQRYCVLFCPIKVDADLTLDGKPAAAAILIVASTKVLHSGIYGSPVFLVAPGNPAPESKSGHLPEALNPVEGPLDLLPRIQQSYWTSMRATGWVVSFRQFQQ